CFGPSGDFVCLLRVCFRELFIQWMDNAFGVGAMRIVRNWPEKGAIKSLDGRIIRRNKAMADCMRSECLQAIRKFRVG
ncbi:MAG: hypothetical protein ACYTE3_09930, partial [Planctomycetota bacterium]